MSGAEHESPMKDEPRDAAAVFVFPPGVPLLTILIGVGLNYWWPLDLWSGAADRVMRRR